MGDEKKRKMMHDIAELFYRRDKAIKDKDTFAFDFTQLDNIGHPPQISTFHMMILRQKFWQ
jgi:hypothetical protein